MNTVLEVKNLFFGYGKEYFLKNICFDVKEGEMVSVIGENGSGKSTLFKVINGNLNNYKGDILYKGVNIKNIKLSDKAKEIAVVYQDYECGFPFTCFDITAMGLYPHKGNLNAYNKDDIDFIKRVMELTDTSGIAHKNIDCVSGGQRQKVLIAKALAQKPKLLFLDEAMSGLDIAAKIKMFETALRQCAKNKVSVINILHDINLAFEKSDRIIALKNGEVHSFGTPEELLNKDFFREVFNVEVEMDSDKKHFRIIY